MLYIMIYRYGIYHTWYGIYHMYIMYITWYIAFVLMSLLVSPNDSQPDTGRLNASVSQAVTLHISYLI